MNAFRVAESAAMKTPRKPRNERNGTVKAVQVKPELMDEVRHALGDGKYELGRFQVLDENTVIVWNNPLQKSRLAPEASRNHWTPERVNRVERDALNSLIPLEQDLIAS